MTGYGRLTRILRIIGRIIGLTMSFFFIAFAIGEGIQSLIYGSLSDNKVALVLFVAPALVALGATILSWWQIFYAGGLLILVYIFQGVAPAINLYFFSSHVYTGIIWRDVFLYSFIDAFTLPFLLSGILLILSGWFDRKATTTPVRKKR